jgi:chromosome partitioning protein
MIIIVASTIRGSGKTTTALNIVADAILEGHNVLAVDGDRQGTLIAALANREDGPAIVVTHYAEGQILRQQVTFARFKYDDIIIDVGDITVLRTALLLADLVLIPFQHSSELEDIAALLAEARATRGIHIPAFAFLWMANAKGNDAAADGAIPEGIECLAAQVGRHKAFCDAVGRGHGILEESYCDPKAAAEFRFLIDQIVGKIASVAPPVRQVPKKYSETKMLGTKAIITLPISYDLLTKLEIWAYARGMSRAEAVSFAVSNLE